MADNSTPELIAWADRLRAASWSETFVFFEHDVAGSALASEFDALAGPCRAVRATGKRAAPRKREAG